MIRKLFVFATLASLSGLGAYSALQEGAPTVPPVLPVAEASDHDDGENDVKARSLNLTDLFVFREDSQTGNAGDSGNLILIMGTNPRSVARQQYYFSTQAKYQFHISRVGSDPSVENDTPKDDVIIRFSFGKPDANAKQAITVEAFLDGKALKDDSGNTTTALGATNVNNSVSLGTDTLTVFAGLKEDPFFFDVEQYFKVRGGAATSFRTAANAIDFAAGYNINAIVCRVPISFLQGATTGTTFDVWETINLPGGVTVGIQ